MFILSELDSSTNHQGAVRPSLFNKLLKELEELRFSGRTFYDIYNEPMIHSDFEGVVQETRSYLPDAAIVVYTNGTRLSLFQALA